MPPEMHESGLPREEIVNDARWPNVTVVRHPMVQERLTRVRDRHTGVEEFRRLVGQIAGLMAFELMRNLPTEPQEVETPLGPCDGVRLARELTLVPVLRAGLGMVDGIMQVHSSARVGHVGIYRDHETLRPTVYYSRLPPDISKTEVIVIDPMLATAGSLNEALTIVRQAGADRVRVLCLVAAPEGIAALNERHGEVAVYTAAVDEGLDERGLIVPGLGDAGDRLFGTH